MRTLGALFFSASITLLAFGVADAADMRHMYFFGFAVGFLSLLGLVLMEENN